MSRIFWDTNLFIYLFEGESEFQVKAASLLDRMSQRDDSLLTSAFTLGEVLAKPVQLGLRDLAARYDAFFRSTDVTVISFDLDCGATYAEVRRDRSLRAPDAIQLSCASRAGCALFITNDDRLSRKVVSGIDFIVSLDRAAI